MKKGQEVCYTIIVTYNGGKWIGECLRLIRTSSFMTKIVVVDNNSDDNTLEIVKTFPEVNLILLHENIGFGRANNIGLKYAIEHSADYCFLLNQDAFVQSDTIELLINSFKKGEFGLISPIHLNGDGTRLDEGFSRFMLWRNSSGFYIDYKMRKIRNTVYPVDFVNAAAWMLTKECILQVGLFHPLFIHYGEDDNYIHRVHKEGLLVGVCAKAFIRHARDGKLNNKRRSDYKKRCSRILLLMLLDPNKHYYNIQLILKLIFLKGRWRLLPDFSFYLWGLAEIKRLRKKIEAFNEPVNPWND